MSNNYRQISQRTFMDSKYAFWRQVDKDKAYIQLGGAQCNMCRSHRATFFSPILHCSVLLIALKVEKASVNFWTFNWEMETVRFTKLLGIYIDENLTEKDHVSSVSKYYQTYGHLRRKQKLLIPSIEIFIKSSMLPYFEHCFTIEGEITKANCEKLFQFQKRASNMVLQDKLITSIRTCLGRLKWMPCNCVS